MAQTLDMGDILHRAGLYLRARGAGAMRGLCRRNKGVQEGENGFLLQLPPVSVARPGCSGLKAENGRKRGWKGVKG